MISARFQGKPLNITVIQVCAPTTNAKEAKGEWFYEDLKDLLQLTPKRDVLFIIGDWNAKVGSQELPGVTSKFGLEVQNEAGKRLTALPRERTGHTKRPLPTTQETVHGHRQMGNTESRWILFFAATDGEALYSQQKQDQSWLSLIMNFLLPDLDLNWKK